MNSIVFNLGQWNKPIKDPLIYNHLINIVKVKKGGFLNVSLVDYGLGKCNIIDIKSDEIILDFPDINSLRGDKNIVKTTFLIGSCRIPVMKRLIKDLSSIGVYQILFYNADLSEKSYLEASIWNDYDRYILEGLSQGQRSIKPIFGKVYSLDKYNFENGQNVVLHYDCDENYISLKSRLDTNPKINLIAIGPERGWSAREIKFFENNNFDFISLGYSNLRVETACISSAVLLGMYSE